MSKTLTQMPSQLLAGYYRGFNHPMKLRLFYKIVDLLGNPRLILKYCNDSLISLNIKQCPDDWVLKHGAYEPEVWAALENNASESEIVWDIGAHIGIFSIRAAESSKVQTVYSFEAHPNNFATLQLNNGLNKQAYNPVNVALSDTEGTQVLHPAKELNTGTFSLSPSAQPAASGSGIEVKCTTVDALAFSGDIKPPTLMKIDVEGWEINVLKGASRLLSETPPKAIVFEALVDATGNLKNTELAVYLKDKGFKTERLQRASGQIHENENFISTYVGGYS